MTLEQFAVFVGSSMRLATPLLFGATGEIVSERAGVEFATIIPCD